MQSRTTHPVLETRLLREATGTTVHRDADEPAALVDDLLAEVRDHELSLVEAEIERHPAATAPPRTAHRHTMACPPSPVGRVVASGLPEVWGGIRVAAVQAVPEADHYVSRACHPHQQTSAQLQDACPQPEGEPHGHLQARSHPCLPPCASLSRALSVSQLANSRSNNSCSRDTCDERYRPVNDISTVPPEQRRDVDFFELQMAARQHPDTVQPEPSQPCRCAGVVARKLTAGLGAPVGLIAAVELQHVVKSVRADV